jgi:hypothetical protein
MSYDLDYPCVACNDPAPHGWRYCVKCHLWSIGPESYDGDDFYERLHPALAWLDHQRLEYQQVRRPPDNLKGLVHRLLRRIEKLERKLTV